MQTLWNEPEDSFSVSTLKMNSVNVSVSTLSAQGPARPPRFSPPKRSVLALGLRTAFLSRVCGLSR